MKANEFLKRLAFQLLQFAENWQPLTKVQKESFYMIL